MVKCDDTDLSGLYVLLPHTSGSSGEVVMKKIYNIKKKKVFILYKYVIHQMTFDINEELYGHINFNGIIYLLFLLW